jgi:3-hydroxyisobutyrate dehydrogenase-like beta-hydroxyacid dehydrogenase
MKTDGADPDQEIPITTAIGLVGLGAMGGSIAARLLAAGFTVYGTDRAPSKAEPLLRRGLIWRDTPREVATQTDVILSRVSDTAALDAITGGPDGILAGLRPGSVYVDLSIVSPTRSRELADIVRELDAVMLEAPILGSPTGAQNGHLTIMVGGNAAAFAHVEPLLRQLARTVTHVGDNGEALWISPQSSAQASWCD